MKILHSIKPNFGLNAFKVNLVTYTKSHNKPSFVNHRWLPRLEIHKRTTIYESAILRLTQKIFLAHIHFDDN